MKADVFHDETGTVVAQVVKTEARTVIRGRRIVWGLAPARPIRGLPAGVVKCWLRQSHDTVSILVLKFSDRVEKWIVEVKGEGADEVWTPGILRARFSLPLPPAALFARTGPRKSRLARFAEFCRGVLQPRLNPRNTRKTRK